MVPCGAGENWWRTTIEELPEDVLLEIFDFYRLYAMEESRGLPWKWHRLVHVCRKWRRAIFRSPRRLGLRILCKYGAPIGSILTSWPILPLVAWFIADQKSKHIPRNVKVALCHPERLCEIHLHVTSSMVAPIVEVTQKPCQALEVIWITVKDQTGPSVLVGNKVGNAFLGGTAPHLRVIRLDGIAFPFPSIRPVLLSTNNLVELHLSNIPNDAYFSPDDLMTSLSTSVQLKRLTVDFHSPASFPPPSMTHPPTQRTTLPSLIFLDFHGASGYLEELVARIELSALCKFAIRLFNDLFFEIPQFCQLIALIPRLNGLRSSAWAIVRHGVDFVRVFFKATEFLGEKCILGTSCRQLDWQLSFVTQILSQLPSLLFSVHTLNIQSGDELPTGVEDVEPAQWLELFQLFTFVTQVVVSEKLVPSIVQALVADNMTAEVLPGLTLLQLRGYRRTSSVAKAAEQFVAARGLTGRTISLTSADMVCHCSSCRTIMLTRINAFRTIWSSDLIR